MLKRNALPGQEVPSFPALAAEWRRGTRQIDRRAGNYKHTAGRARPEAGFPVPRAAALRREPGGEEGTVPFFLPGRRTVSPFGVLSVTHNIRTTNPHHTQAVNGWYFITEVRVGCCPGSSGGTVLPRGERRDAGL